MEKSDHFEKNHVKTPKIFENVKKSRGKPRKKVLTCLQNKKIYFGEVTKKKKILKTWGSELLKKS